MDNKELLKEVKSLLLINIEDEDFDRGLLPKVIAAKCYIQNAGASPDSLKSELGITCIAIGVNDLLNQDTGKTQFSPAFFTFANQIARL
ncbi:MAG: hypothetical protein RR620_13245 [Clostridium sp.]